jgi:salicylate hydroxylase
MAVEDGAILGVMLGQLNRAMLDESIAETDLATAVPEVLQRYESSQKRRTTINVQGAVDNRRFFHMEDGPEQEERDELLKRHTWMEETSEYKWCDMPYNRALMDVDVVREASEQRFSFSWAVPVLEADGKV